MHVIRAQNVEHALQSGLAYLQAEGRWRGSRNGRVLVSEEPVTTVYEQPRERVVFWSARDANPFFHLYESLWMLAGRNDVDSVARYVRRMRTFSDDGAHLNAAYGYRWRRQFSRDQLQEIVERLTRDPDDRRSVLQIWDQQHDFNRPTLDAACNLVVHFQRAYDGALDMTVFCRSNDVVWGAYGANAVHFSYLQEFVASFIGCAVGRYWQVSDNYHVYENVYRQLVPGQDVAGYGYDWGRWYRLLGTDATYPLVSTDWGAWHEDLKRFMAEEAAGRWGDAPYGDEFFNRVAVPMARAHEEHRRRDTSAALGWAAQVADPAWALAATMWLERRRERRARVQEVR